jgi:hypothetical protein
MLNNHLWEWMDSLNATLVIQGDPSVAPILTGATGLATCEVTSYWPINYNTPNATPEKDYTSGVYDIMKVVHQISPGSYTTTLYLTRSCQTDPTESDTQ